jgi:hypothetical protein
MSFAADKEDGLQYMTGVSISLVNQIVFPSVTKKLDLIQRGFSYFKS